jgi:hypothetical protein
VSTSRTPSPSAPTMTMSRPCTRCGGQKSIVREFTRTYPGGVRKYGQRERLCPGCGGIGEFAPPSVKDIVAAIVEPDGTLRSNRRSRPADCRECYVWYAARVNRGADRAVPPKVQAALGGDPWIPELDQIARALARRVVTASSWPLHELDRAAD